MAGAVVEVVDLVDSATLSSEHQEDVKAIADQAPQSDPKQIVFEFGASGADYSFLKQKFSIPQFAEVMGQRAKAVVATHGEDDYLAPLAAKLGNFEEIWKKQKGRTGLGFVQMAVENASYVARGVRIPEKFFKKHPVALSMRDIDRGAHQEIKEIIFSVLLRNQCEYEFSNIWFTHIALLKVAFEKGLLDLSVGPAKNFLRKQLLHRLALTIQRIYQYQLGKPFDFDPETKTPSNNDVIAEEEYKQCFKMASKVCDYLDYDPATNQPFFWDGDERKEAILIEEGDFKIELYAGLKPKPVVDEKTGEVEKVVLPEKPTEPPPKPKEKKKKAESLCIESEEPQKLSKTAKIVRFLLRPLKKYPTLFLFVSFGAGGAAFGAMLAWMALIAPLGILSGAAVFGFAFATSGGVTTKLGKKGYDRFQRQKKEKADTFESLRSQIAIIQKDNKELKTEVQLLAKAKEDEEVYKDAKLPEKEEALAEQDVFFDTSETFTPQAAPKLTVPKPKPKPDSTSEQEQELGMPWKFIPNKARWW